MADNEFLNFLHIADLDFVINFTFDLQQFAAEDEGRTEDATEYKKKKARDEGNVPKSQELVGIFVFLICFWTVSIIAKSMLKSMSDILSFYLNGMLDIHLTINDLPNFLIQILTLIGRIVVPIMAVGVISALIANVGQSGFIFSAKKLNPDFGKLISKIGENFKKMFFSTDTLFNLIKSLMKVVGVFFVAFLVINAHLAKVLNIARMTTTQALSTIARMALQFVSFAGIMLLVFALADYAYQRYQHAQSLKMTKHEIKEEFKEHEGNPEIKAKVREMERRILSRKMIDEVPNADVVITNPTHIAIALKFDRNFMTAPMVVAKGEGLFANRIKEVAREAKVFIVENKPLARGMYKMVEVGDEIPAEFFAAVAGILATVYQMRREVAA